MLCRNTGRNVHTKLWRKFFSSTKKGSTIQQQIVFIILLLCSGCIIDQIPYFDKHPRRSQNFAWITFCFKKDLLQKRVEGHSQTCMIAGNEETMKNLYIQLAKR